MEKELEAFLERVGKRDEVVISNLAVSLKDLATNYEWFDSFDPDTSGVPYYFELPDDFEETLPNAGNFMKSILKGHGIWEVSSRGVTYQLTAVVGEGEVAQIIFCSVDTVTGMFTIQRIRSDGTEVGAFSHNPHVEEVDKKIITARIPTKATRRFEGGETVVPVFVEYYGHDKGDR